MFSLETEIDEDFIDDIYNHVHHGRCFYLLEKGRLALMEAIGQPNERWLKNGVALVITSVNVQYKRELKRGPITITCDTGRVENKRIVVEQRILNSRGKVAVVASIESAFMSTRDRRGMDVPQEFWASFEAWVERQNVTGVLAANADSASELSPPVLPSSVAVSPALVPAVAVPSVAVPSSVGVPGSGLPTGGLSTSGMSANGLKTSLKTSPENKHCASRPDTGESLRDSF